jgi:hypothetical protein
MSEENQVEQVEIDYRAMAEELQAKLEKSEKDKEIILAKKEELYNETKKAKQERAEQVAAAQRAEQEKALKDGEFEKLWKRSEQERKEEQQRLQESEQRYNQLLNETKQKEIHGHAMNMAVELADGNAKSAKLLARFVQDSLSKISDEKGVLDESVVSAVRKEFQNNAEYAPLLGGSKASGGGALGGMSRAQAKSSITRADFAQMSPNEQAKYAAQMRSGEAVLTDN